MRSPLENFAPEKIAILDKCHPQGHSRIALHLENDRIGGMPPDRFEHHIDESLRSGLMVEVGEGLIATTWLGWAAYRYGYATNMN